MSLPEIDEGVFRATIVELSPVELTSRALGRLYLHYQELCRWNRRLSLVGPGTHEKVLERHYGESLAALPLLNSEDEHLVDVGSGAGFPGFVLAVARPDLTVTLVEARQKKWSFLSLVCEKVALPCHCLNARVGAALPDGFSREMDVVTTRAVRFSDAEIVALAGCLSARGRFLVWAGRDGGSALEGFESGRQVALAGAESRSILEFFPVAGDPVAGDS